MDQSQKGTIYFYLFEEPRVVEFMETENGMVIARGWGERNELLFWQVQFVKLEKS